MAYGSCAKLSAHARLGYGRAYFVADTAGPYPVTAQRDLHHQLLRSGVLITDSSRAGVPARLSLSRAANDARNSDGGIRQEWDTRLIRATTFIRSSLSATFRFAIRSTNLSAPVLGRQRFPTRIRTAPTISQTTVHVMSEAQGQPVSLLLRSHDDLAHDVPLSLPSCRCQR